MKIKLLQLVYWLLFIMVMSCNQPSPPPKQQESSIDSPTTPKPKPQFFTDLPSQPLQNIAAIIQTSNWIPDTSRLKKVPIYQELDREGVQYFNGLPFYPLMLEKSRWYKALQMSMSGQHLEDKKVLEGVSSVWGYFYKKKEAENWITDGVIEQWTFETEEQADKALKMMKEKGGFIYFNTTPYPARMGKLLFVFQSRAAAFSHAQQPVFEQFVEANAGEMVF